MDEIGKNFKVARTESGLNLEEVSNDTKIPKVALEQIEEGSIGSFKDIFVLRNYLTTYAKYLGMDDVNVIDKFNEYMFEYTTRLSADKIEKEMHKKEHEKKEDTPKVSVYSPYLKSNKKAKMPRLFISIIIIIILAVLALLWAVNVVYR